MKQRIRVGSATLLFVSHPRYATAHPGESCAPGERCRECALAKRSDTGELVLLWRAGRKDWSVSRADPHWARHRADFFGETAHG